MKLVIFFLVLLICNFAFGAKKFETDVIITQDLKIGASALPDASGLVDMQSTTKGLLIPRMGTTARNNISSPATGLMIYNTDTNAFNFYNGTVWGAIGGGGSVFDDATFKVEDQGGDSFGIFFDVSAATADRTITWPNTAVNIGDIATNTSNFSSHTDGGANKHDGTEIDYERADGSKKNIQAASDDLELATTDLDDAIGALAGAPTNYTPSNATIAADHLAGIDTALGTKADTDLNNLATTSINTDLLWSTTGLDVGTEATPTDRVYVNSLFLTSTQGFTYRSAGATQFFLNGNYTTNYDSVSAIVWEDGFASPNEIGLATQDKTGATASSPIYIETGTCVNGNCGNIILFPGISSGSGVQGKVIQGGIVTYDDQDVTLTADNQNVTPTHSVLHLTSDSITSTDRTFTLQQCLRIGQQLTIIWIGSGVSGELIDDSAQGGSGTHRLSANWTPDIDDVLVLMCDVSNDWVEISRSAN